MAPAENYPTNWDGLRREILTRDNHECVGCGKPATDVDHVAGIDSHHPDNLQALCRGCHVAKTSAEATARAARKHRPRRTGPLDTWRQRHA